MTLADVIPAGQSKLGPLVWRRAWLEVDRNESAQRLVQSLAGRIALVMIFSGICFASGNFSTAALALIAVSLLGIVLLPAWRITVICGASLFYLGMRPFRIEPWRDLIWSKTNALPFGLPPLALQGAGVVLFLAFAAGFLFWQRANSGTKPAKRPILTLILIWFGLFAVSLATPTDTVASSILWTLTGVFVSSIWFLAYAAADQKTKDTTATAARASLMRAFWGGSATPIGKSFGYLNKFDAKDEIELAATRLKALKLVVWALWLTGLWVAFEWLLRDQLGLPELNAAILAHAYGVGFSGVQNWASLLSNYFLDLIIISIWGHFIVAIVRMCGYRIPRNTVNPLASRTLAEFWNRYFFYFKELLVDFFFYPTFVRWFKKSPKLRIAFATFCAAGVGNFLYHFMRETHVFATMEWQDALAVFQNAGFYSLALATGLILSQLRKRKPRPEDGFWRYEVTPRIGVIGFFCFLKIFDDITGIGTLTERAAFTISLFTP